MRPAVTAALLGLVYFGALHALEPRLADYDGYFHVRFASLGPSAWLGHDFPWMPHGVFAGGHWVDHQWLFHALMWPFTKVLPLLPAAHASAAVFAALAMGAFAGLLADRGVSRPVLWSLALLGASRFFDDRMLMPRTQGLALAGFCVGLAFAFRGRAVAVAIVAGLFAWTYHVSLMLVPCALVAGLAGAAGGDPAFDRRGVWAGLRPGLSAALGAALGMVLNPQFPDTFTFLWLHAVQKIANHTRQAVGAEWMPADTRTWLLHVAPVLALVGWGLWGARRTRPDTRALGILAIGWLVASMFAVKWLEYAVPFCVATAALLWRDRRRSTGPLWLGVPLLVMNGAAVLDHVRTTVPPADRLEALAAHLPATDCHVFQADWTDFSELFYWAPQCSFTVGLDPHFLSVADPERALLVEGALAGRVSRLGEMAATMFDAGWVVTTHPAMEAKAAADPRLEAVYREDGAGLWRVLPAPSEGAAPDGAAAGSASGATEGAP